MVGDGIKGAKFEIYVSKDKTENGTYQKLDSTYYYTDENGIIHLDNLDTGWYKVVEVEPAPASPSRSLPSRFCMWNTTSWRKSRLKTRP